MVYSFFSSQMADLSPHSFDLYPTMSKSFFNRRCSIVFHWFEVLTKKALWSVDLAYSI